jgi:hypothetical protein
MGALQGEVDHYEYRSASAARRATERGTLDAAESEQRRKP